jgi:ATP/ADP translocase
LQDNAARRIDEIESIAKEKDNQNRINLLNKQKEVDKKSKQTLMLAGFLIIVVLTGSVIILLNRYRLRKKNITELPASQKRRKLRNDRRIVHFEKRFMS